MRQRSRPVAKNVGGEFSWCPPRGRQSHLGHGRDFERQHRAGVADDGISLYASRSRQRIQRTEQQVNPARDEVLHCSALAAIRHDGELRPGFIAEEHAQQSLIAGEGPRWRLGKVLLANHGIAFAAGSRARAGSLQSVPWPVLLQRNRCEFAN